MKGKITVLWLGKTARGNGRLRVHCLSGSSEQDMAFPRCGYGLLMGQGTPFRLYEQTGA